MPEEETEEELEEKGIPTPIIETSTEFGQYLITPTVPDKTKDYHKYVTKEMAISYFLTPKYVYLVLKYFSLIEDFIFLGIKDMAIIYDAELQAFLNSLRSVGGFERDKLTTVTQVLRKATEKVEKKGWFAR